jgi:hypothetical protein
MGAMLITLEPWAEELLKLEKHTSEGSLTANVVS